MKFLVSLLLVGAAGTTLPVAAQDAAPANAQQEEAKQAKEGAKICRNVALNPDSRRKERLCLTATEWRELNNPR